MASMVTTSRSADHIRFIRKEQCSSDVAPAQVSEISAYLEEHQELLAEWFARPRLKPNERTAFLIRNVRAHEPTPVGWNAVSDFLKGFRFSTAERDQVVEELRAGTECPLCDCGRRPSSWRNRTT